MNRLRATCLAATAGLLLAAGGVASSAPKVPPKANGVLDQLAHFAVRSVQDAFTLRGDRWYASCPYALGTYSYIELGDLRRKVQAPREGDDEVDSDVTERLELTLHPHKARFYWFAGRTWKDYGTGPTLRYFAERHRNGTWTFEADQHVCAHGEPQKKPDLREIPNG